MLHPRRSTAQHPLAEGLCPFGSYPVSCSYQSSTGNWVASVVVTPSHLVNERIERHQRRSCGWRPLRMCSFQHARRGQRCRFPSSARCSTTSARCQSCLGCWEKDPIGMETSGRWRRQSSSRVYHFLPIPRYMDSPYCLTREWINAEKCS